jgi:hypothetical protein
MEISSISLLFHESRQWKNNTGRHDNYLTFLFFITFNFSGLQLASLFLFFDISFVQRMTTVFKVFSEEEYDGYKKARESGQSEYLGSELDRKDAFIHLSDLAMAQEVIKQFFKGHLSVHLVEFLIPLDNIKLEKLPGIVPNSFCYHLHEVSFTDIN